jgi:class 3 adenylate cyclase/Flp pilus assembly protein TadD
MGTGTEQRRLAAIMFTDMVGYSALAQRNEKLALELLEEHRALLRALLPRFNGVEIKTIGDAFLVEFSSALEATQCAIEVQRALARRNADAPMDQRIGLKIGIHIGDVIHREGDVLGDGVNIASRIEPLAGAGGICVSVDVERQIRSAIEVSLVKLAATELKNIQAPMELFRVVLPWERPETKPDGAQSSRPAPVQKTHAPGEASSPPQRFRLLWPGATVLLFLAVTLCVWLVWPRPDRSRSSSKAPGRIISLAVKPLDDFSGDTNQAYLSDGMTEALCAALGNLSALRVPGRSSVMRYKGGQKSIQEMAKELNVDAIVEGSIQRAGSRILVTAQLIEAATDRHLWSTSYERDLGEFFKVQNEVARAIATQVQARLTPEDQARLARARAANPQAVEAYLLGRCQYWGSIHADFTNVLQNFQKAIAIDPNYAPAHAGVSLAYQWASITYDLPPQETMPKSKAAAQRAIELDPLLADGYAARGYARMLRDWDWAGAETDFKRALELSPRSPEVLDNYGCFLTARGRSDEAIALLRQALESDPLSPFLYADLSVAYLYSGQFERAVPPLRKALEMDPNDKIAHLWLGWSLVYQGKTGEALAEFQTTLRLQPDWQLGQSALGYAFGVAGRRADALKLLASLDELAGKRYVSRCSPAWVHLGLGQNDAALGLLEKACEERDTDMPFLKVDPGLAPLHKEPRFRALLKKVGLDP